MKRVLFISIPNSRSFRISKHKVDQLEDHIKNSPNN